MNVHTWEQSWTKGVLGGSHNKTHTEDGGIRKAKPQAWMIRKSWRSSDAFLNLLCLEITKDFFSHVNHNTVLVSAGNYTIFQQIFCFQPKSKTCKSTINILLSLTKLLASEKILILALLDPIWITHLLSEGVWKLMGGIKKPFHLLNYSSGIWLQVCCQPRSVWRGQHLKLFGTGLVQALPNKQVTSVLSWASFLIKQERHVWIWSYFPHSSLLLLLCSLAYLFLFNAKDNTIPILLACDVQCILTCDAGWWNWRRKAAWWFKVLFSWLCHSWVWHKGKHDTWVSQRK